MNDVAYRTADVDGLTVLHPERITAIITQNGNAYEEGLSDGWNPVQAYWKDPSPANRDAIRMLVEPQTTIWQYTHGVPDATRVSPDVAEIATAVREFLGAGSWA